MDKIKNACPVFDCWKSTDELCNQCLEIQADPQQAQVLIKSLEVKERLLEDVRLLVNSRKPGDPISIPHRSEVDQDD